MQQTSDSSNSMQWPLFAFKSKGRIKKFWTTSNLQKENDISDIKISGNLFRLGKKKMRPKQQLCASLLQKRKNQQESKGMFIVKRIHLVQPKISCYKRIEIYNHSTDEVIQSPKNIYNRTEQVSYKLYCEQGAGIFEWWNMIIQVCTINNFDDMYQPLEVLGRGSFATVFKVKRLLDGKDFAAKFYYKDTYQTHSHKEKFLAMITNESKILRQVQHPGIVAVYEMYQQSDKIVLIMDYVLGKDLYYLIRENRRLSERKVAQLVYNLTDSLKTLTDHNYVHRDLKLENILVDRTTLQTKIVDFGFAEKINPDELTNKAGTPGYIAPEVFRNEPYTDKGDVFSLGIIFYSLIGGYSPFRGRNYRRIMEENQQANILFDRSVWNDVSNECKDLIKLMTNTNQRQRISFQEILNHPWIQAQYVQRNTSRPMSELRMSNGQLGYNSFMRIDGTNPRSFYQGSMKSEKNMRVGLQQIYLQRLEELGRRIEKLGK